MKHKYKIALLILVCLLVFVNFTARYSNSKKEIVVKYNGLLWVGLDYWSIWKYHSTGEPMKILTITNKLCD